MQPMMTLDLSAPTPTAIGCPDRAGLPLLRWLAAGGLLGAGVPMDRGGRGGALAPLRPALRQLWAARPAAAAVLRAQRLAIEALLHAPNRALAEHLLPQLLAGERAASVPGALNGAPLLGHDTGRGWHLGGVLPLAANLLPEGFTLVAPVRLGDAPPGWAALRGEEDGLDTLPPHPGGEGAHAPATSAGWARAAALGDVRCRRVFFREDEWLGGAELLAPLLAAHAWLSPTDHD